MSFKPFGNWILVDRDEKKKQTESGLLIPDSVKRNEPPQGIVVAIGEGEINEKTGERYEFTVQVGDRIVFSPNVGEGKFAVEVDYAGKKHVLLKEAVIYGILD